MMITRDEDLRMKSVRIIPLFTFMQPHYVLKLRLVNYIAVVHDAISLQPLQMLNISKLF